MHDTNTLQSPLRLVFANLFRFLRHPAALAVGFAFAADSVMFGAWVTHIPYVKSKMGLSEGELGLVLFGLPMGLLLTNPFSPWLLKRLGLVPTTVWSTVAMALTFTLPMWVPQAWMLFVVLFLLGISVAILNVAINTCATNIETEEGIHIMSSCHGMWSLGGMLGSGVSAMLIAAHVPPQVHVTTQALLVIAATLVWLRPALAGVPEQAADSAAQGANFALPNRDLWLMIFIGLCTSMCEGIAFDWSAVYLREGLGASAQVAALAFTGFSLTMMAMRFTGDVLVPRFGDRNLLYFTVLSSAVSLLVIIIAPVPAIGILGFLLLGMGVALSAPILFNAAARVPGFVSGAGLATFATFSFIGFLSGPPLIGLIGEHWGLPAGFSLVAVLTLVAVLAVRKVGYLRSGI